MRYFRYRIKTTVEAEDLVISAMQEIGFTGAQIEDHVPLSAAEKEQQFIYEGAEPDETTPDDGVAYLSFYVAEDDLQEAPRQSRVATLTKRSRDLSLVSHPLSETRLAQGSTQCSEVPEQTGFAEVPLYREIHQALDALRPHTDIGAGTVTVDVMDDADWKDNWKQFFHKFYIDDILILPSWEEADTEDGAASPAHTLRIDPGTAFGTGAHETTQLCIRALRTHLREGDRILDVGTGSGVLSILALMFGASYAVGTDLDPQVITAVADNLKRNHIGEERFRLVMGNLIDDPATQEAVGEGYDLVLANILPTVLVPLTPVIPRFLKAGGIYITSGILTERIPEVKRAMEKAGLTVIETTTQGEWNAIVAQE